MEFLGMGGWEIFLILLIALIFVGPARIVQVARSLGKVISKIRSVTSDITSQINREVDEQTKDIKETVADFKKDVTEQSRAVSNAVTEIQKGIKEQGQQAANLITEAQREIEAKKEEVQEAASSFAKNLKSVGQASVSVPPAATAATEQQAEQATNPSPAPDTKSTVTLPEPNTAVTGEQPTTKPPSPPIETEPVTTDTKQAQIREEVPGQNEQISE